MTPKEQYESRKAERKARQEQCSRSYDNRDDVEDFIDRVATALERIADALERRPNPSPSTESEPVER